MKKSEMISKLRTLVHCLQKVGYERPEIVAEMIIDLIEKAGMLPPSIYLKTFDVTDNVWESEEDD